MDDTQAGAAGTAAVKAAVERPKAPAWPTGAPAANPNTLPPIDDVLYANNTVHGQYATTASLAQALKAVMKHGPNWEQLPAIMREALEMEQTKIARIISGDMNNLDAWRDLQGYPRLVEIELTKPAKK